MPPAAPLPPWGDEDPYAQPFRPPQATTNGLAIAALVTSLVGLGLIGLILGHIALGQIKRLGQAGRGMALAGTIIGYASIAITLMFLVVGLSVMSAQRTSATDAATKSDLSNAFIAVTAYGIDHPEEDEVPSFTDGSLEPYGYLLSDSTESVVATGSYQTGVVLVATSVSGKQFQIGEDSGVIELD